MTSDTVADPSHPSPPQPAPAEPFSRDELMMTLWLPHRITNQVLGHADRLGQNLARGEHVCLLVFLLLATSLLATVPYSIASPLEGYWRLAILFTGSLLICFPSLHVFSRFLGFELELMQTLALALLLPATAGLFCLSFAPIIWFIDFSMEALDGSVVTPGLVNATMILLALFLGIVQMARCMRQSDRSGFDHLLICWLALLLFIIWRMAWVVGVL